MTDTQKTTCTEKVAGLATDAFEPLIENVDSAQVARNILTRVRDGKQLEEFAAHDWMEVFGLSENEIEEMTWDKVEEGLRVAFAHDKHADEIAGNLAAAMKEVRSWYARFSAGEISEVDFLYESEWACLDAVIGILVSYLRGNPIKLKVLKKVIDDETLTVCYQAFKSDVRGAWEETLARCAEEQRAQNEMLEKRYRDYIEWLEEDLATYREILPRAFSDDPETALAGSVELALFMKLPQAEVLATIDDVDDFFLN